VGIGSSGATPGPALISPDLLILATTHGAVRVLIHLEVPADVGTESVKRSVLAAIAHTRHRVLRALPGLPLLAVEASLETLGALASAPGVQRVEEDSLSRLQQ
jgi:hypothetical protein